MIKKETRNLRRAAFWKAVNVRCVVCGEAEPMFIDFHHVAPKQWKISHLVDRSIAAPLSLWPELLERELEKTIPLCVLCHRKLHYGVLALSDEHLALRPSIQKGWLAEWQFTQVPKE